MPEQAFSNSNGLLQLWAIVGPLLVGAVSQVWNRWNKVKDREFEEQKEFDRVKREFDLKELVSSKETVNAEIQEAKSWYLKFMSSSHEYISKKHDYHAEILRDDLQLRSNEARDRLITSLNGVTLVGNEDVEGAAIDLFNATIEVADVFVAEAEGLEQLEDFKDKRLKFSTLAKDHLGYLSSSKLRIETSVTL